MAALLRLAAFGLVLDDRGRLLLRPGLPGTHRRSEWTLPGGAVEHAEHPRATVERELVEATGLTVSVGRLVGVYSQLDALRHGQLEVQTVSLVYRVRVIGGDPAAWAGDNAGATTWWPVETLDRLQLAPFIKEALIEATGAA
jgi:8-oxo-dGTP diphosphatase